MKFTTLAVMAGRSAVMAYATTLPSTLSTTTSLLPQASPIAQPMDPSIPKKCGPVCVFFAPDGTCIHTVDGCTVQNSSDDITSDREKVATNRRKRTLCLL
ncbi:hypothetical protein AC579_10254 [Pseudocercospora musae]|uniref:Uncharacterized protein n=1 Tax=Pseudocercospora musae TaxID=113226 RepID=A0A139HDM8_9PEZI|nr:hypothetical protein AC579_10254 [Pseudocercospora musae]